MAEKELETGLRVRCQDGAAGKVSAIVVDPETRQPSYLVVKRNRLPFREIVVPVSLVDSVTAEAVMLDIRKEALKSFPDYEFTVKTGEFNKPLGLPDRGVMRIPASNRGYMVLKHRNVPEQMVEVKKGTSVWDSKGNMVGKVHGIIVDSEKKQVKYVIMQPSSAPLDLRLIPTDLVAGAQESEINLSIAAEHVNGLGIYQHQPAGKAGK